MNLSQHLNPSMALQVAWRAFLEASLICCQLLHSACCPQPLECLEEQMRPSLHSAPIHVDIRIDDAHEPCHPMQTASLVVISVQRLRRWQLIEMTKQPWQSQGASSAAHQTWTRTLQFRICNRSRTIQGHRV